MLTLSDPILRGIDFFIVEYITDDVGGAPVNDIYAAPRTDAVLMGPQVVNS